MLVDYVAKKNLTHTLPHKFVRKNLAKTGIYYVYKCVIPGCPSYFVPSIAEGMNTLCTKCDGITTVRKNIANPVCDDCSNPVSSEQVLEVLDKL